MKKFLCCILLLTGIGGHLQAKHLHKERWYQEHWCTGRGVMEYRLPDKSRVDCLTKSHAIEFDFAGKWAEAIGQALYYSSQTGKAPGIVLILEKESDRKHFYKIQSVIKSYKFPIRVEGIGPAAKGLPAPL